MVAFPTDNGRGHENTSVKKFPPSPKWGDWDHTQSMLVNNNGHEALALTCHSLLGNHKAFRMSFRRPPELLRS